MKRKYKQICKIGDARLPGYVKRTRSGKEQVFYTGDDSRDFDRYRAEGGQRNSNVKMHDKSDTIRILPPEKHYHSELIDGVWWWVNECAECNGLPRDWMTYIECDKHNVCAHCQCTRESLTETPWGRKSGWVCKPCADKEHEAEKAEALSAMPEEYNSWDYCGNDDIKCPYCNLTITDDDYSYAESDEEEIECHRCENTFTVTASHSVTYTTERTGENKDTD